MIQLLDIKVDVVFKDFFGDKTNKEVLESFINSVLGLKGDDIVEVEEFLDPRKMRIEVGKPTTFVDLSVRTRGGERYIIEMQTYNHEGFDQRLLYYLARISHQTLGKLGTSAFSNIPSNSFGNVYEHSLQKLLEISKKQSVQSPSRSGEKYGLGKDYTEQLDYLKKLEAQETKRKQVGWRDLPRVHVIAIVDFHRSKAEKDGILNGNGVTETYEFKPTCDEDNNHLFDQWRATIVDLKKFKDKPFKQLHKYKEWWFFLLKNASRIKEEELEKLKQDPVFRMALERLERLSSDPKTRKAYEESINEQRNLTAIKQASIKEGHDAGRKEGLKEGEEKGRGKRA